MEDARVITDARLLEESLGTLPDPAAEPALIVVSGLPGTGKSYLCKKLAERQSFLVLESDALRKTIFAAPSYTQQESAHLFQTIHRLIEMLLKRGISIILDGTNLSEQHRERLYNIAERLNARLILVRVEAPPDVVHERLRARAKRTNAEDNSDADWTVYQKMKSTVQKINRNHFAVDTSRDITPVIEKILREANR